MSQFLKENLPCNPLGLQMNPSNHFAAEVRSEQNPDGTYSSITRMVSTNEEHFMDAMEKVFGASKCNLSQRSQCPLRPRKCQSPRFQPYQCRTAKSTSLSSCSTSSQMEIEESLQDSGNETLESMNEDTIISEHEKSFFEPQSNANDTFEGMHEDSLISEHERAFIENEEMNEDSIISEHDKSFLEEPQPLRINFQIPHIPVCSDGQPQVIHFTIPDLPTCSSGGPIPEIIVTPPDNDSQSPGQPKNVNPNCLSVPNRPESRRTSPRSPRQLTHQNACQSPNNQEPSTPTSSRQQRLLRIIRTEPRNFTPRRLNLNEEPETRDKETQSEESSAGESPYQPLSEFIPLQKQSPRAAAGSTCTSPPRRNPTRTNEPMSPISEEGQKE